MKTNTLFVIVLGLLAFWACSGPAEVAPPLDQMAPGTTQVSLAVEGMW